MKTDRFLSFQLPDEDIQHHIATLPDPWESNLLGHIVFLRTYSRRRPDGSKERWAEVVRRCVEGAYSIQKDWCISNRIPWYEAKAIRSANEMYERMYAMKFTPPGRGLWMMGTEFVHERMGAAALQNCAFVSTKDIVRSSEFLMEALMLGVGVGFDTAGSGTGIWRETRYEPFTIPDSREGWVESVSRLIASYVAPNAMFPQFDYSKIREAGQPIRGFGGVAAGPSPLRKLHHHITRLLDARHGEYLSDRDVVDLMNLIGQCVVAGNVRRSAEIALGTGEEFMNLKNYSTDEHGEEIAHHPAAKGRSSHGWMSNNSIVCETHNGAPYCDISELIARNGEPGMFWLDISRRYGRLGDPPNDRDYRATGTNPCGEQTLESFEMCNLVETYPSHCDGLGDYLRTLKFAYLYAKSVTLLPTHWPETNAIMLRNRRIGCSMTGVFQFSENHGVPALREHMMRGYEEIQRWDRIYSEWLCVRESIKTTSIKPSGTVSKLAGVTPGVHAPPARQWIQRIIFAKDDPLVGALRSAGYHVEPSAYSEDSVCISIPVQGPRVRTQHEVSMWEKAALAALAQRDWADNAVSCTVDFDPDVEAHQIVNLVHAYEGQLKAISFFPRMREAFEQQPMEPLDRQEYQVLSAGLGQVDLESVYQEGGQAHGDKWCDSESCEVPQHP